jgi:2'-5' RNA ligase
MKKRHRVFIAINLPQEIKKELVSYQKKWSELTARWVSQDNLHITLAFLGYLTDLEIGEVCMITKKVTNGRKSFDINLNKISYGPIGSSPRMIWVGGEKSKELSILKSDLEKSLSETINFRPENRAFNSHITLARLKAMEWRAIDPEERPEIAEDINLSFPVESIEVMESKLKRTGPIYTILESFNLRS